MVASWWQTIVLAVIGAVVPYGIQIINGDPSVTAKTIIVSAVTAALTALANILRSPLQNPPSMVKGPTP